MTVSGVGDSPSKPIILSLAAAFTSPHMWILACGGPQVVFVEKSRGWSPQRLTDLLLVQHCVPSFHLKVGRGSIYGEEGFQNRLCLHVCRFKDRVISAYSGSSLGNARGLM